MARLEIAVPDELARELRKAVAERLGGRKGDLGDAVTDAIRSWMVAESWVEPAMRGVVRELVRDVRSSFESAKVDPPGEFNLTIVPVWPGFLDSGYALVDAFQTILKGAVATAPDSSTSDDVRVLEVVAPRWVKADDGSTRPEDGVKTNSFFITPLPENYRGTTFGRSQFWSYAFGELGLTGSRAGSMGPRMHREATELIGGAGRTVHHRRVQVKRDPLKHFLFGRRYPLRWGFTSGSVAGRDEDVLELYSGDDLLTL